ncbi:uncharacterized protein LOC135211526 [Macrobrachium nipponense]|uniref:uncharacterized protein LOC135211526 n=1 Tax=Macrobrachium nipponense TaxID=159736 RepID=UPI0030C84A24
MATGTDESYIDLIQLEQETQQTLQTVKSFTQSYQDVWSQVGDLSSQIKDLDQKLVDIQGTIQHLTPNRNNTQPPIMSTPHTSHIPGNPFSCDNLSTITGTPQYVPPIPPCTNTKYPPQNTTTITSTVPLIPINVSSTPPNPAVVIQPPTHHLHIPNPSSGNSCQNLHTSQSNPFILQQGQQTVITNPFFGPQPTYPFTNTNPFFYSINTPVAIPQSVPVLKPKDVALLKLSELKGVLADNRLNTFFRQVESCTSSDDRRIEVAMARAEPDIATFLTAALVKQGNNLPWDEIKKLMKKQFIGSATLLQAWQEITAMTYYFDEPPSSFINKLQCKISALTLKFPNDPIPTSDKFLKTKVYKGLNSQAQAKLVDFLADHIPLENFMTWAEEEYYRAQGMNGNRVLPISGTGNPQSSTPVTGVQQGEIQRSELDNLRKKLEELNKKTGESNIQNKRVIVNIVPLQSD